MTRPGTFTEDGSPLNWPRVRDLLRAHRAPFEAWLKAGKRTRPWIDGVLPADQDGYYQPDYDLWLKEMREDDG